MAYGGGWGGVIFAGNFNLQKIMKHTGNGPRKEAKIIEGPLLEGGIVMDAANLRRDAQKPGIWRRAGRPKGVFPLGVLPFLRFSPFGDGREIELSVDGDNSLYGRVLESSINDSYPATPVPVKLTELEGEPILAVTSAKGIIRLMLRHAPDCFLTYTEGLQLTYRGEMPQLPEITLEARDSTIYYASTGQIALTGGSSGAAGSKLCEGDAVRVKTALLGAYQSVKEQALHNGDRVQPLTARYRLLDAAGNTVALGEKVALGCTGAVPTSKVALTSSDGMQTLAAGSLSAKSYNPVLVVPERLPYPWNVIINRLVVEITEEMEPVDPSAALPHGVQRNAQSGVTTVTAQLPGLEIEDLFTAEVYSRLAARQLEATMYRAYTFADPYGEGLTLNGEVLQPGEQLPLWGVNPTDYEKATEGDRDADQRGCTYSAALDAGEYTILCNPKEDEGGEYRPGVAQVVRSSDLGEILSTRLIMNGEIVKVASLPRSGSGWDFSRLKLLMFGPEGSVLATLNGKGEFHSLTTIDRREVRSRHAVCEGTGGNGATLLAIAGGDVVEISGQKVTTLWHRGELPRGRFGAETLAGLRAIGWNGRFKEIWLADEKRLWRLCRGAGSSKHYELIRASLPGIEGVNYQPPFRLGNSRGDLLLATSSEVRNLSDELQEGLMDVVLRIRGEMPRQLVETLPRFPLLQLSLFGSELLGNYTLRGDRGTEIPEELLKVVFTGDVNEAVHLRMALPYRRWLEECYTFAANDDFAIHDSQFVTRNQ